MLQSKESGCPGPELFCLPIARQPQPSSAGLKAPPSCLSRECLRLYCSAGLGAGEGKNEKTTQGLAAAQVVLGSEEVPLGCATITEPACRNVDGRVEQRALG